MFKKVFHGTRMLLGIRSMNKMLKNHKKYPESLPFDQRYAKVAKKSKILLKMYGIKYRVSGVDNIPKRPCLFTPNHADNADPIILMNIIFKNNKLPLAIFLAKKELGEDKRTKASVELIDSLLMDRQDLRQSLSVMDKAAEIIQKRKLSLVIFPEGTRSPDGQLGEFKPGAFKPAFQALAPIIPVTIRNSYGISRKDVKHNKKEVEVIFHAPIFPKDFSHKTTAQIAEHVKKVIAGGM